MGEVIDLHPEHAEIEPKTVLSAAIERDLQQVVVVGWTQGGELYLSMSHAYVPDLLWLVSHAQKMLMNMDVD